MIKLYSTPICPYCHTLKEFLKERDVVFTEVDVSVDQEAAKYMIEKTGQMGVPVLEVAGEMIIGFDRDRILQLLKLEK